MFTGLVTDIGTIETVAEEAEGLAFRVRCGYTDLALGESIAVSGACMTVLDRGPLWFTFAAIATSLGRTGIAAWTPGRRVNLERSLRAGDRMGGHMVQGHVDGVGTVLEVSQPSDARLVDIEVGTELFQHLVQHGSVAVDGVSLTVNEMPSENVLQISLIDYTLRHTTLGTIERGDRVHIEGDVIGKYVRRLVAPYAEAR